LRDNGDQFYTGLRPRRFNVRNRGRFDRGEPTLYNGEDLDVPTFIRRAVSLKR
jgi:hypothetical protein